MKFVLFSFVLNRRINRTRPKYWNAIERNWWDWPNVRWISNMNRSFYALTQKSKTHSPYWTMAAHWFQWIKMNWSALQRGMTNNFQMFMFAFELMHHGSNRLSIKIIMIHLLRNNIENKQFFFRGFQRWLSHRNLFYLLFSINMILMFAKHSMCLFT